MRLLIALLVLVALAPAWSAVAGAKKVDGHDGPDAGRMIVSLVGAGEGYVLTLRFRRLDEIGAPDPAYRPFSVALGPAGFSSPGEHAGSGLVGVLNSRQAGAIFVKRLPPGDYAFYSFQATMHSGFVTYGFKLPHDVSAPFRVRPGRTVYIGEFKGMSVGGSASIGERVRFEVSDRSDRDLAFALRKDPKATNPEIEIVDVERLADPLLTQVRARK
jgi:hypothetical protein